MVLVIHLTLSNSSNTLNRKEPNRTKMKLIQPQLLKGLHKKLFFHSLTLLALGSLVLFSCQKEEIYLPPSASIPVLSASSASLELNELNAYNPGLTFTWTSGTNHGTNAAIEYTLQIDKKGNGFSAPVEVSLGRAVYAKTYKTEELNNLLRNDLGLTTGVAHEIEARLKSATTSPAIEPDFSNVITVSVTPYEPVTTTLYAIGTATPNGWSADNATALRKDNAKPGVFIYEGPLTAGELKFITTLGQFLPSYNKGASDRELVYRSEDSQPDEKFIITKAANYQVTVDLLKLTISFVERSGPAYNQLWIVGDATPKGWDIDNADLMVQDPSNPYIFTFNEVLKAGEFKIATAKDWGAPFYRPTSNHPPISSTEVQLSAGDPDHKWYITDAGAYKITLNLQNNTIAIVPFQPYERLWMVGDATPNGWNIDNPNELTKSPTDPYVFTYTGPLNVGEFKFPTSTGDWGTDYFMPAINYQPLTDTAVKFVKGGDPDNKWKVEEAGNYTITLNQLKHTIAIQKN
jgi:hypothetical protein